MSDVTKLYAAYKAGYLGDNILDTYFSFVANILVEEHISVVEDHVIASKLSERYSIDFPLPFIRQVLGVGVQNNCFVEDHGKYSVVIEELSKYRFQESNFNSLWSQLINEFEKYCRSIDVDISSFNTEEFILRILDASDEVIISDEKVVLCLVDKEKGDWLADEEFFNDKFGKDKAKLIMRDSFRDKKLVIRANTSKISVDELTAVLKENNLETSPGRYSINCIRIGNVDFVRSPFLL